MTVEEILTLYNGIKSDTEQIKRRKKEVGDKADRDLKAITRESEEALDSIEKDKRALISRAENDAKSKIKKLSAKKADYEDRLTAVRYKCERSDIARYTPKAVLKESEIEELSASLRDSRASTRLKRWFGAQKSEREIAAELFERLSDACLYYAEEILKIVKQAVEG